MAKITLNYPDTGLTIGISVLNRDTGVEAFSGTLDEIGTSKVYVYDFTEVVSTDYIYIATCAGYSDISGTVYRDGGGLTTLQADQLASSAIRGGGEVNISGFITQITNLRKELQEIKDKLNEPEEKEIVDFTPILDKIDSIEIPEVNLEEKEAKKALKLIENLDKKLTSYIDKEMNEKDELGAITREFTRIEMEHNEKKMKHEEEMRQKEIEEKKKEEEERKMEAEQDKILLEEIKSEFAKLEEEDKAEKKKEIEMELKELAKEMKEKEKELKTL